MLVNFRYHHLASNEKLCITTFWAVKCPKNLTLNYLDI